MVLNREKNSTSKVYSLLWNEFSSSLSTTAQNLRSVEDLTDVTISAGGKIFPAHKLVLGAASPLLMELLRNTKCQHPILMLAGVSACDFELILDFIYRGEINIDSDKLPSLLQAAKLLDIRALISTALVLNSFKKNTQPMPVLVDKVQYHDTSFRSPNDFVKYRGEYFQDIVTYESPPLVNESDRKNSDNLSLKRKVEIKQCGSHHAKIPKTSNDVNGGDTVCLPKSNKINTVHVAPSSAVEYTTSKPNDAAVQEANEFEEKKIISDLPVNCKFCGVTIRQSRNLRRHIDQMHSKMELKSKSTRKKSGKRTSTEGDVDAGNSMDEKDTDNSVSPLITEFSEDSFSQLTEEILNYSAGSESEENSFCVTTAISSTPMNECAPENPRTLLSASTSSSPITRTRTLSTLLGDDICFQLSTKSNATRANISHASTRLEASSSDVEQFACSHLDDSSHVNDIALKELENQLFSACFCTTENI